jgi:RimJ/RimL family protein N-acetyltransferase
MTQVAFRPPSVPLTDGVVQLRPWHADDLEQLLVCCADPEVPRWTLMPDPYEREHGIAFLGNVDEEWRSGTGAPFCVTPADSPDVVGGAVGVFPRDGRRLGGIGYWIGAEHRRRGYATRAVELLCDWAFHEAGFERLVADVITGNEASMRVLERAGFRLEGYIAEGILQRGIRREGVLYTLARPD